MLFVGIKVSLYNNIIKIKQLNKAFRGHCKQKRLLQTVKDITIICKKLEKPNSILRNCDSELTNGTAIVTVVYTDNCHGGLHR